jgi:cytochrome c peroxidase
LGLNDAELQGLVLFNTKAQCAKCHVLTASPDGKPPVFTDYTYDNLGVPVNPANPFFVMDKSFNPDGRNWKDPGLGGFLKSEPRYAAYAEKNMGKHKVPTLRNVDLRRDPKAVKVFMHNGSLQSLKDVVHFYNARDVARFPAPEVKASINTEEMGNLKLTDAEENTVVAFLKTLSDHYIPPKK